MRLAPVAITLLLVGFLVVGVGVASASQPDITVEDSIDTPEETIELEGNTYEVSSIAERSPGDKLTAEVTIPETTDEDLFLYNSDTEIDVFKRGLNDGDSATFDTSSLEPGTYMLALRIDGNYEAVHPVVISGYDMELSHPTETAPSESVTVTADVVQTHTDRPLDGVDVVVHGAGNTIDVTADQIDDETYEATVDFDEHAEGDYQVYAAARNGGDTAGYPTLLGATAGETITVSADDDGDSDDGDSGDGGSDDTDDSPPDESDDDSDSEQEQEEEQDSDESAGDDQDEETDTRDDDESGTDDGTADNGADDDDDTDGQESEDSDEDDAVIDPNGDEEPSEPADDDQSLPLIVPILGLVVGAFAISNRSTA